MAIIKDRQIRELFGSVLRLAKKKKAKPYLVGGYLRDILLEKEKENPDIDFCLKSSAINFGRQLARMLKAGFVVLDKERGACRIVKKIKDKLYTIDFTDFRAKALEQDLLLRDFTINAIALGLEDIFQKQDINNSLIDPYNGRADLKRRIIRAVSSNSFKDDPLRIMRAFSFSSMLGFKIDKDTLRLAKKEGNKLVNVSGERIREELFKVFRQQKSAEYLKAMDELKILEVIFPEIVKMRGIGQGPYHHLDVWQHTLETIRQLEGVFEEKEEDADIRDYLDRVVSSERSLRVLIKMAAFLHDAGKPKALFREGGKIKFHGHERIGLEMVEGISRRLRLSNDEANSLRRMVLWHLRPGYLAETQKPSDRAKFRYFRDAGQEAVAILLLSLADQRATKGLLTTRQSRITHEKVIAALLKEYFKNNKEEKQKKLINGFDVMQKFNLKPSSLVGKILREVEELQAIGKIKTRQQALEAAGKFVEGKSRA